MFIIILCSKNIIIKTLFNSRLFYESVVLDIISFIFFL